MASPSDVICCREKRTWLEELDLPAAAREQVTVALTVIDMLDAQSEPLTRELRAYGRRQPGCRALRQRFGAPDDGARTAPLAQCASCASAATADRSVVRAMYRK
jgi:hypothetical protein